MHVKNDINSIRCFQCSVSQFVFVAFKSWGIYGDTEKPFGKITLQNFFGNSITSKY